MESMGIMGFMLGGAGMTFALIALGQVANVKKELTELKASLDKSGNVVTKQDE
ncbi:hypothetical protein HII17_00665 [Thalassotalea sp. M1531]|uniref:Uncharacterized protein n=1 Tax=Thalassotalea algicola TaxID=2716224 RepID=A0A7Y0L8S7_9GAMM|nr:hypothetical protein [Thalassotalea algicola]NMP30058.1 hypothetical protein [Thalassotalea algicola]